MKRIAAIDFARGIVMIIMALDHTRDLFHIDALTQDPTDLATTTPWLFFTRWITHFCAPTFVFLAGLSAYLSVQKQQNLQESKRVLRTRGLWLIALECTIVNFALWFDIQFRILMFQVIGSIGVGFLLLSLLLRFKPQWLLGMALVLIIGHSASALLPAIENPLGKVLWALGWSPNLFPITGHFTFFVSYPILPWFGIMLAGYAFGSFYTHISTSRSKTLNIALLISLVGFCLVRLLNVYGANPSPWQVQENPIFTFLSILNTNKYPPSLAYTCMTLSGAFALLRWGEKAQSSWAKIISLYGNVPLFYYVVHWYVLHSLLLVVLFAQGANWQMMRFEPFTFGRPEGIWGLSLGWIYAVWLSVVIALYPLCRWYEGYKKAHIATKPWLRYC